MGAHPREIAKKYDLEIQDISNDKYLVSEADYLIVGGAGILSENIINQNKVINVSKDKIQNNRETSNKIIDDNKDKQNQNGGEKK